MEAHPAVSMIVKSVRRVAAFKKIPEAPVILKPKVDLRYTILATQNTVK